MRDLIFFFAKSPFDFCTMRTYSQSIDRMHVPKKMVLLGQAARFKAYTHTHTQGKVAFFLRKVKLLSR